jgi:hypothetical protein
VTAQAGGFVIDAARAPAHRQVRLERGVALTRRSMFAGDVDRAQAEVIDMSGCRASTGGAVLTATWETKAEAAGSDSQRCSRVR